MHVRILLTLFLPLPLPLPRPSFMSLHEESMLPFTEEEYQQTVNIFTLCFSSSSSYLILCFGLTATRLSRDRQQPSGPAPSRKRFTCTHSIVAHKAGITCLQSTNEWIVTASADRMLKVYAHVRCRQMKKKKKQKKKKKNKKKKKTTTTTTKTKGLFIYLFLFLFHLFLFQNLQCKYTLYGHDDSITTLDVSFFFFPVFFFSSMC